MPALNESTLALRMATEALKLVSMIHERLENYAHLVTRDGVDGKDGAPGATGPQGIAGINGVDGLPGRDGVDGTPGRDGIDGVDGLPGEPGKAPEHEIVGDRIRFKNPDGSWGKWIDFGPAARGQVGGGGGQHHEFMTQASYDALPKKRRDVVYMITG